MSNRASRGQENHVYSEWHREALSVRHAMTKIDGHNFCALCNEPLWLEDEKEYKTIDNGRATMANIKLARRADLPFLMLRRYQSRDRLIGFTVYVMHNSGELADLFDWSERTMTVMEFVAFFERVRDYHESICAKKR